MGNKNNLKTVSLVVACYNESGNLEQMWSRVKKVFSDTDYQYELIFVDNASVDNSDEIYQEITDSDSNVAVLKVARNTGNSQPSYLAGLRYASGDAVVLLDGDLQDPPEVIPSFIKAWEEGAQVVYGVRIKRKETLLRRFFYFLFYRIFNYLSYLTIPLDAGDFGLLDRVVVNHLAKTQEHDLYLRGLRAWVGFRQVGVNYVREERNAGFTTNSFWSNLYWAKKAIVNFSHRPLELISYIAFLCSFVTGALFVWYLVAYFYFGAPQGFTTQLLITLTLGSIQLCALSVISEYLIRIFEEVKGRPPYLIERVIRHERMSKEEQS